MAAWQVALETADRHLATWADVLESSSTFFHEHAVALGGVTVDLMAGAYSGYLLSRQARVMAAQAAEQAALARALGSHAEDFFRQLRSGSYVGDLDHYDDLVARGRDAVASGADAADGAANPRLPKGLHAGLGALGALASGYGVYDDVQQGESTEQAVVSQGGGLLAGIAAGGLAGAAAGSIAPGAGTVVGGIVGGVVGGVTAIVVDDQIDKLYESDEPESVLDEDELADLLDDHRRRTAS